MELLAPITGPLVVPERAPMTDEYYSTRRLALLRGKVINYLVSACATAFIEQEQVLLQGRLEGDLISHADPVTQEVIGNAKLLARKRIFESPQRHRTELGASAILERILDGFVPAALEVSAGDASNISFKSQKYLALMGTHQPEQGATAYQALCQTMDFVAGMTDKYAVTLSRQLGGELL